MVTYEEKSESEDMCHRKLTEHERAIRDETWAEIMGRPPKPKVETKPRVQTAPPEEKDSGTRNPGRVGPMGKNHTKHKLWIMIAVACIALAVAGIVIIHNRQFNYRHYGFVASKNSKVFHKPDCYWAKQISSENLVTFWTYKDAKDSWYHGNRVPCHICIDWEENK